MDKNIQHLLSLIKKINFDDGINDTLISEFKVIKSSVTYDKIPSVHRPSLCVILQGAKDVIVGDKILSYKPGEYIFCSVEVPVTGRVTKASSKEPYLCLMVEVDPSLVYDVLKDSPSFSPSKEKSGAFVSKASAQLIEALSRLVSCMDRPSEAKFLSGMIIREILFRLLNDENGDVVRQMGVAGSQTQKISEAIGIIKKKFNQGLNIEQLARTIGMSPSSFHKYFKDITNMSPLQYQKLVRLQEARRLLISDAGDAATVGYEVGYESPSQFSREYSRFFGLPPKSDIKQFKS